MLNLCDAVCVTPPANSTGLMHKLAMKSGFRSTSTLDGAAPDGPIRFYLVDYRVDDRRKEQIISRVRGSGSNNVKYAPVILIVGNCPADAILTYSRYGFDDIVTLPQRAQALAERFEAQLNRECLYYETETYFGPDRRRWSRSPGRETGKTTAVHFEHRFSRDPTIGVRFGRRTMQPPSMVPGLLDTMERLQRMHR